MFELATWQADEAEDGSRRQVLELPFRVAGYDIDFAGIVNNQVYIRWLEDMRTVYMGRWLSLEYAFSRGLAPTLIRTEVDYRWPLRLGDRAIGRMWTTQVGRASALIETEIRKADDDRICAHALQTVCFVESATGKPARMPPEFRAALIAQS